jgi:hypothetical protein
MEEPERPLRPDEGDGSRMLGELRPDEPLDGDDGIEGDEA